MADEDDSLAAKLRAAMIRAGLVYQGEPSARALAILLAGDRAEERRVVDDYRKQVRRWLRGGQSGVQARTAALLAGALDTPVDYWPVKRAGPRSDREAISVAEDLIRRLDAGESVPLEQLERVADQLEETAHLSQRLADRLREGRAGAR